MFLSFLYATTGCIFRVLVKAEPGEADFANLKAEKNGEAEQRGSLEGASPGSGEIRVVHGTPEIHKVTLT